jgi:hypothetical protein
MIKKGKMCCLFINDLDAGAGRFGLTTQYTVNNQMVNATLMNIADNPTNVQLPGVYKNEEIPRVPIICTGEDQGSWRFLLHVRSSRAGCNFKCSVAQLAVCEPALLVTCLLAASASHTLLLRRSASHFFHSHLNPTLLLLLHPNPSPPAGNDISTLYAPLMHDPNPALLLLLRPNPSPPAGNDFSTLYAPLIRDGRMEKYYWNPTREDRVGVCMGIFNEDNLNRQQVEQLVDAFPGQSIDFFGALRARVYDDKVRCGCCAACYDLREIAAAVCWRAMGVGCACKHETGRQRGCGCSLQESVTPFCTRAIPVWGVHTTMKHLTAHSIASAACMHMLCWQLRACHVQPAVSAAVLGAAFLLSFCPTTNHHLTSSH